MEFSELFTSLLRQIVTIILLSLGLLQPTRLFGQDFKTTIKKTVRFEHPNQAGNELRVYNINGPVTVEGYDGTEIQVTAEEHLSGSNEEIERAKDELQLKLKHAGNKIIAYLDAPFIELREHNGHISYNVHRDDGEDNYDFIFNIHIRVPEQANIQASTINKGDVLIRNSTGAIYASNINGALQLEHITGKTDAHTINGNITAKYDLSPAKDSEYHTINGKIEVYYPQNLSADIRFKSMHGDLYTDFTDIKHLKARVQTKKEHDAQKTTYRVDRFTPIRIGGGGPTFNFHVLNGDVYIKKIQS